MPQPESSSAESARSRRIKDEYGTLPDGLRLRIVPVRARRQKVERMRWDAVRDADDQRQAQVEAADQL
jgi:hypothetical protein